MEDSEEQVDEDTAEDTADDEAQPVAPKESAEPSTPAPDRPEGGADVESIEDLLAKKEGRRSGEEEADDSLLTSGRDDRLEPLAVKVVPPQPTEFVCKNCYLVKHQSQLADKKRMFCRDCA